MTYTYSDLERRMESEDRAARDLQKVLEVYQANRTPYNRKAYLR